jgi:hypothetical protein
VSFRVTNGGVTVTLDGQLEAFVADLVARTQSVTVDQLRAAAEEVAAEARASWYGPNGVKRRTGQSGDIVATETVDVSRGEIRISVGSTDPRVAGSKPVPVYVHRPTRTSTIQRDTDPATWYGSPESMRGPWRMGADGKKIPTIYVPNPDASDGKHLLPVLVRAPMKKRAKAITAAIAKEVAGG